MQILTEEMRFSSFGLAGVFGFHLPERSMTPRLEAIRASRAENATQPDNSVKIRCLISISPRILSQIPIV
jgi:hypothetical protein